MGTQPRNKKRWRGRLNEIRDCKTAHLAVICHADADLVLALQEHRGD